MKRTRAIPSALRRATLPVVLAGVIGLAGCSDASDASSAPTDPSVTTADSSEVEDASNVSDDVDSSNPSTGADAGSDTDVDSADDDSADESQQTEAAGDTAADSDLGAVGSLDSGTVHTISVEFDDADYEAMIDTYSSTGEKEWIEATVTIDGTTYDEVGMRLKGNSSLRGVAGGGGGGPMGDAGSAEDPETLPWLIDLDQFVDDQDHDGLTELVVRSNSSETSLNEAVALELLDRAGLASQDAVATAFSVNGSDEILRLVIDNPDDEWMAERLDESGALYKAESTGDYSYRGDDPESYDEVFDQEAGQDNADLTPLIEFLQFINESDDPTFAAELPDRLDVDSFATYLAMQELLANFDDIDGPGNNSYLYYDTESEQFTVIPWDYNLAFGTGFGGPGGRGGGGFPGGERPDFDDMPEFPGGGGGGFPGGQMPTDGEMPQPPGDGNGGGGFPGGGFGPGGSNVLVERFLAVDEWNALYEDRLEQLRAELVDSGMAQSVLDEWSAIVASSGLVVESTVASEADQIAQQF